MALMIIATPGAANANSFATEAEFIAYAAARLNVPDGTTVDGTSCTDNEKKALVEATRELTQLDYDGSRVTATQVLAYPRMYAFNPDTQSIFLLGNVFLRYFDSTVIPSRVRDATIELALEFLKAGTSDIAAADDSLGVIEETIDVLTTRWSPDIARPQGLARFPRVAALVTPLLSTQSGALTLSRQ